MRILRKYFTQPKSIRSIRMKKKKERKTGKWGQSDGPSDKNRSSFPKMTRLTLNPNFHYKYLSDKEKKTLVVD
jgi:hypothetical protein